MEFARKGGESYCHSVGAFSKGLLYLLSPHSYDQHTRAVAGLRWLVLLQASVVEGKYHSLIGSYVWQLAI